MDNRGSGRTPRGRKPRRSRGQADSPRTGAAASSDIQSPVSSSPLSRDDRSQGTSQQKSQSKTVSTMSATIPEEGVTSSPEIKSETMEESENVGGTGDEQEQLINPSAQLEEKSEETPEKKIVAPPQITPTSPSSITEYKTPLQEIPAPEIPLPSKDTSPPESTTEAKVEEIMRKSQKPVTTAKTLVVTPPEVERSSDAPPLVVDLEKLTFPTGDTSGAEETRPSSSASQLHQRPHSRAGSVLPSAVGYALCGPLGKPGYIGGVGFSDEEGDTPGISRKRTLVKRESAIAAVETAVKGFTKRQWTLLFMFGLIDFLAAITISLQAPFYPAEAEKKGASATEFGFVFGIFEFIVFLFSPIFGKYMNKLGPKMVFSVCIFITSVSVICFGLLDRIEDHTLFITLCFVCRIFEALGCAGFFTSTFVIIAMEFPERIATTFASLETFFGLGLIVGPTVGGGLFGLGGFPLPFFVVGTALLLTAILSTLVMPKIEKVTDEDGTEQSGFGVFTILKIPSIFLAAVSIASTSMSLGYVSAILEPHIRSFQLTPLQTGLIFIVNGGVYALTAPIFGYICDYMNRPVCITILGNILIFGSFLLIGPASFMPFDTILWVTIVGLFIQGLGFGCCLVSGFITGLRDSLKHGLPDNMATYGVASGLWTSMISLGAWVGPTSAGILYDNVGFREGSYLILVAAFIVGVANIIHTCCTTDDPPINTDIESQPLLRPISPILGTKKEVDVEITSPPTSSYGTA